MILKYKLVIFMATGALSADLIQCSSASQEEVQKIDTELKQLQDLKNRYRASAARHEHEAMRWQFEQDLKQEARRATQQAELDREMERQIQARIDYLEARKIQINKK